MSDFGKQMIINEIQNLNSTMSTEDLENLKNQIYLYVIIISIEFNFFGALFKLLLQFLITKYCNFNINKNYNYNYNSIIDRNNYRNRRFLRETYV